jgi:hypothetical protein
VKALVGRVTPKHVGVIDAIIRLSFATLLFHGVSRAP